MMDGFEWIEKVPKFLRWILWIPVPYIASRVILWLVKFGTGWFYPDVTDNPDAIWWALYDAVATPFILGFGVYIIVPKYKFGFGLVQPIVWCCIVSFAYLIAILALVGTGDAGWLGTWEGIRAIAIWIATIIATVAVGVMMFKQYIEDKRADEARALMQDGGVVSG